MDNFIHRVDSNVQGGSRRDRRQITIDDNDCEYENLSNFMDRYYNSDEEVSGGTISNAIRRTSAAILGSVSRRSRSLEQQALCNMDFANRAMAKLIPVSLSPGLLLRQTSRNKKGGTKSS